MMDMFGYKFVSINPYNRWIGSSKMGSDNETVCSICLEKNELLDFVNVIPKEEIESSFDDYLYDFTDCFYKTMSVCFGNIKTFKTFFIGYVLNSSLVENNQVFSKFINALGLPIPKGWMFSGSVNLEFNANFIFNNVLSRGVIPLPDNVYENLFNNGFTECVDVYDEYNEEYSFCNLPLSFGNFLKDADIQFLFKNERVFGLSLRDTKCFDEDTETFFGRKGSFFDIIDSMSVDDINAWFRDNRVDSLF